MPILSKYLILEVSNMEAGKEVHGKSRITESNSTSKCSSGPYQFWEEAGLTNQ